jgi:hypothetical protein
MKLGLKLEGSIFCIFSLDSKKGEEEAAVSSSRTRVQ